MAAGPSSDEATDLVAVALRKIDEFDIETALERVVGYYTTRSNLVPVRETKIQSDLRSGEWRNEALDEYSLCRQIVYPAIPAGPAEFATGTQEIS